MSNDAAVSPAYERYARTTHFGPLDGLRALAVILVMRNHIDLHGAIWQLVDGSRGVPIFFVLSGYLITTLALREERRRGSVDLGAFYWRRSLRIFPAYYAVLTFYCVIVFANLGGQGAKRDALATVLPYFLTYMNEYAPDVGAPFGQSWTLGIEEKFYLVWPAVAFVLLRARAHLRLGIAVVAATAAFAVGANHLTFHYACILCGCVLAMVLDSPRGFALVGALARPFVHHAILIGFIVYQLLPSAFELRRSPLYPLAVVLVIATLLLRSSAWTRVLASKPATFIAERSYGVYLLHVLAANVVVRFVAPTSVARSVAAYALCILVSLAAAHVLHVVVERPCIAFGRRRAAARASGPRANPLAGEPATEKDA